MFTPWNECELLLSFPELIVFHQNKDKGNNISMAYLSSIHQSYFRIVLIWGLNKYSCNIDVLISLKFGIFGYNEASIFLSF